MVWCSVGTIFAYRGEGEGVGVRLWCGFGVVFVVQLFVAILLLISLATGVILVLRDRREAEARRKARDERYKLEDTGKTIPLAPARSADESHPLQEIAAYLTPDPSRADEPIGPVASEHVEEAEEAREVLTEDGPMRLTEPPFEAREGLVLGRRARFASALARRVPPWILLCPRVRLDALVRPTSPIGHDPVDWSRWRRRARVRAADFVLVDRRTWKPVLVLQVRKPTDARLRAGGRDRMIGEILEAAGIPYVEVACSMSEDWPRIRDHLNGAVLEPPRAPQSGWDSSAAANLLRLDDEEWVEPDRSD